MITMSSTMPKHITQKTVTRAQRLPPGLAPSPRYVLNLPLAAFFEGCLLTSMTLQNSLMQQMERLGLKEPFRRGSHGTWQ